MLILLVRTLWPVIVPDIKITIATVKYGSLILEEGTLKHSRTKTILLFVLFLSLFSIAVMPAKGKKAYLKGIASLEGTDWTCVCKNEPCFDCFCIIEI